MGADDWWRVLNFCLALSTLTFLIFDTKARVDDLSKRRLYLTFALGGFVAGMVVGSVENIIQNNPVGIRTAMFTSSCALTLIGLWVTRNEPT